MQYDRMCAEWHRPRTNKYCGALACSNKIVAFSIVHLIQNNKHIICLFFQIFDYFNLLLYSTLGATLQ